VLPYVCLISETTEGISTILGGGDSTRIIVERATFWYMWVYCTAASCEAKFSVSCLVRFSTR